jgi:DNA helicase-2/ATP-dependent DNA helicase PcrA
MTTKLTIATVEESPQTGGSGSSFVLSPEQEKVVNHRGGHLQVIACAGAGKTEAISRRVASLILDGAEPSQIIAFTFTDRAAQSLKTRITKRIAEAKGPAFLDRLGPMFVGTIHSYCLRMLQDHVPEFGNFDILDENRLAGLLSREHKRLELSKLGNQHWRPIFDFLRNADVVENELIDGGLMKGTPFGDCYLAFKQTLYRYHFLTYGLLISAAVKALSRPEVANRVRANLRYLIVDEYQDVNPAQEKLISLLAQDPVQLCVVADDDQSIYQWRGSDVSNMLDFRKRYSPAISLTLSVNRRCRPKIISSANAFATSIAPRLTKKMEPHRQPGGPEVHGWAGETDAAEAVTIADTIERLRGEGFRYKDIAILYRSVRTASPPLIEEFKKRDMPFRCAGRTGLFLQPEASALGKLYAFLSGNEWKSERYGESQSVDLDDVDHEFAAAFNEGETIPDLRPYLQDWQAMVKDNTAQVNLVRDYYRLLRLVGVNTLDLDDPADSARMGTLARFSQILADFEHVTRRARYVDEQGQQIFRGGQDRGIYFYQRLYNYLQYYALDAYEDFEGEDTFDLDAVDILTVHQSKGLEWPVVFLPSLVEGRFPSRYAGQSQDWLLPESVFPASVRKRYEGSDTEERRLFYVALTRAKDVVYLSRFRRKTNKFKPSPFLLEIVGADPELADQLPLPPTFTPSPDGGDDLPTVSFSELASYEGCPLKYRFSSSLGFQPQLVAELGYGRAIHHILRHIAEATKSKQQLPTLEEVEKVFAKEFYLPFANNAAFHNLLDRARSLVGKYLSDYSGELLRVWETERPFELHLEKGVVNGRADVILDREGGVVGNLGIVDYKTANDAKSDDVFAFQLAIYAAAGRGEGLDVKAAYLHALKESVRKNVPVDNVAISVARKRADTLIEGIVAAEFPPRPELSKCKVCDMRAICKHAQCSKYDL